MPVRVRRGLSAIGAVLLLAALTLVLAPADSARPANAAADAVIAVTTAPARSVVAERGQRSSDRPLVLAGLGFGVLAVAALLTRLAVTAADRSRPRGDVSDAWRSLLLRAPPTVA
jgi:flagellin-like protein